MFIEFFSHPAFRLVKGKELLDKYILACETAFGRKS